MAGQDSLASNLVALGTVSQDWLGQGRQSGGGGNSAFPECVPIGLTFFSGLEAQLARQAPSITDQLGWLCTSQHFALHMMLCSSPARAHHAVVSRS
jgi:hypothetical protein